MIPVKLDFLLLGQELMNMVPKGFLEGGKQITVPISLQFDTLYKNSVSIILPKHKKHKHKHKKSFVIMEVISASFGNSPKL